MIKKKFFLLVAFIIILIIAYKFNKNNKKPFTLPSSNFTSTTTSTSKTGRLLPRQISSSPVSAQTTIPQTTTKRRRLIISKNITNTVSLVSPGSFTQFGRTVGGFQITGQIDENLTDKDIILDKIKSYLLNIQVEELYETSYNNKFNYFTYYSIGRFITYFYTSTPPIIYQDSTQYTYIGGIRLSLPAAGISSNTYKISQALRFPSYHVNFIGDGSIKNYDNSKVFSAPPGSVNTLTLGDLRTINYNLFEVAKYAYENKFFNSYNYYTYFNDGSFRLYNLTNPHTPLILDEDNPGLPSTIKSYTFYIDKSRIPYLNNF